MGIRLSAEREQVPAYLIQRAVVSLARNGSFTGPEVTGVAGVSRHTPAYQFPDMKCIVGDGSDGSFKLWGLAFNPIGDGEKKCRGCREKKLRGCVIYDAATGKKTANKLVKHFDDES